MKECVDMFGVQSLKQWVELAEQMDKFHDEVKDPMVVNENEESKTDENIPRVEATVAQGWLKHSFVLSLYYLLRFNKF